MNIKLNRYYKQRMSLILFIAPFTLLFSVFFLYPSIKGLILSFSDWNGISKTVNFTGLKNYIELLTNDGKFLNSLKVTLIFTVFNVSISNILALLIAVAIESGLKFKNTLRTLFFLPYIFSLVVVGFTWRLIYTEVIPHISKVIGLGIFDLDYIGDPNIAIYSVIFMNIWYGIGYFLIIYLAGLQSIDKNVIEAAVVDGATGFKQFLHVKIPLLMPAITICLFTSIAGSFKVFDAIFVLTSGGPGYATEAIALNIYYEAFGSANRFGYGMAKAVVLAIIVLIISYFQLKFFKSREVEA